MHHRELHVIGLHTSALDGAVFNQEPVRYVLAGDAVARYESSKALFDGSDRCYQLDNSNSGSYGLVQGTTARMMTKFTDRFGNIALANDKNKGLDGASQITGLGTSSFTMFYVVAFSGGNSNNILHQIGAATTTGYYIYRGSTTSNTTLLEMRNTNVILGQSVFVQAAATGLRVIAVRKEYNVYGDFWIDGAKQATTTNATWIGSFTNGSTILMNYSSYNFGLYGYFYECTIYTRALTDAEILENTNYYINRYGYGLV